MKPIKSGFWSQKSYSNLKAILKVNGIRGRFKLFKAIFTGEFIVDVSELANEIEKILIQALKDNK